MDSLTTRIESDLLAGTDTQLLHLHLTEALSESFEGEVELEVMDPDLDPATLVGTDLAVVAERAGVERRFAGLVTAAELTAPLADGIALSLRLEPGFATLDLARRSRVFQELSVPDIVEAVLGEGLGSLGRAHTLDLDGDYPVREYCVQYRESNRAFVARLLEEEGIWFTFTHDGSPETLLLRDTTEGSPQVEGTTGPVPYVPHGLGMSGEAAVRRARVVASTTATDVSTHHQDWTSVQAQRGTGEDDDAHGPRTEQYQHGHGFTLTLAEYGGRYRSHDAGPRAERRAQELASPRHRLVGTGEVLGFTPGHLFELVDHPVLEANAEHLLVRVEHVLGDLDRRGRRRRRRRRRRDPSVRYRNTFVAQPSTREYRPPQRTERPAARSLETAVVVGPAGEEIHTDEHGRIKVQFHWDREGAGDDSASCWMRCAQPWAGAQWGAVWIPRIGMEVLVTFEHGDPDRPLVTEAVYKGDHTPPYPLPDEKTKSTIKSNSSLGGGGFNELRFEDLAGSEEVYLHAQKDLDEVVLNNHTTRVGAHQRNEVHHDQEQIIHENQTETVGSDQSLDVGSNRTVTVNNHFHEDVIGSETRLVDAGSDETITGGETHTVTSKGLLEIITGGQTRTIKDGGFDETIDGDYVQGITATNTETISGNLYREGANITLDASTSITLTGTSSIELRSPARIQVTAPSGSLTSTQNETVDATSEFLENLAIEFSVIKLDMALMRVDGMNMVLEWATRKHELAGLTGLAAGVYMALVGQKKERGLVKFKANALKGECKGFEDIK